MQIRLIFLSKQLYLSAYCFHFGDDNRNLLDIPCRQFCSENIQGTAQSRPDFVDGFFSTGIEQFFIINNSKAGRDCFDTPSFITKWSNILLAHREQIRKC